jgi:hypothetical protein
VLILISSDPHWSPPWEKETNDKRKKSVKRAGVLFSIIGLNEKSEKIVLKIKVLFHLQFIPNGDSV